MWITSSREGFFPPYQQKEQMKSIALILKFTLAKMRSQKLNINVNS